MFEAFKSLPEVIDHFKDNDVCVRYLEQSRWNGEPFCPHCGSVKVYRTNRGFKCADKTCHKKFTVTVGSIFENSKIPLRIWFAAIYLLTAHKKGISSLQLGRDLNVTQKTAWFMNHRIRAMLKEEMPDMLDDDVEVDETFVGGKQTNKHQSKQAKRIRSYNGKLRNNDNKTPVVGAIERGGRLIIRQIDNADGPTLKNFVRRNVLFGSNLFTDEYGAYKALRFDYEHEFVTHGLGEYRKGRAHTNTIEGAWGLLKRGIIGIYHYVSPKHLHRYCDEFQYKYNERKITDGNRFELSVKRIPLARLRYKDLIKKV